MSKPTKPVKKTRAELERKIMELEAQLPHRYQNGIEELRNAGTDKMMASGILLQLTALGGRPIINPVVIKDGLSDDTITALRMDLKRSYDQDLIEPKGK